MGILIWINDTRTYFFLDKCYRDSWNLFKRVPYIYPFLYKIYRGSQKRITWDYNFHSFRICHFVLVFYLKCKFTLLFSLFSFIVYLHYLIRAFNFHSCLLFHVKTNIGHCFRIYIFLYFCKLALFVDGMIQKVEGAIMMISNDL